MRATRHLPFESNEKSEADSCTEDEDQDGLNSEESDGDGEEHENELQLFPDLAGEADVLGTTGYDDVYDDVPVGVSFHGYWKKTVEELAQEFRSVQTEWKESKECKTLFKKLEDLKAEAMMPVTNVVALGTASLHSSRGERKGLQRRTGVQLAAILTIRDALGGKLE
jgi:hypothetical protein